MKKRTKRIEIAVTEEEYRTLQNKKTKPRLAEWIRDTALGVQVKKKTTSKKVDQRLLYEINRIGVNLNQIARYCNIKKADIDLVRIAVSLRHIEEQLKELDKYAS